MASYVTPKKNAEYIFYIGLPDQADTKLFKSSPTIAAGDFKVATDGGALGNLGTLPAVTPAASKMVKITLSASEMNGDNATLVCSDAAGAEWADVIVNIQTSANQIDDLALASALTTAQNDLDTLTGSDGATLATTQGNYAPLKPTTAGRTLDVTIGGTAGIDWGNVENKTTANDLSATDIQLCDTVTTNADAITVAGILTTQMTEAYAADGTAPTLAQALFLIQQSLHEFAIADTTRTVKKLDGSTTAATFTLDDATSPTSTTRAT